MERTKKGKPHDASRRFIPQHKQILGPPFFFAGLCDWNFSGTYVIAKHRSMSVYYLRSVVTVLRICTWVFFETMIG